MLSWSYTSCAKMHLISFVLRSVCGKLHNKPGDVKFKTLLRSFALFSPNLHTIVGLTGLLQTVKTYLRSYHFGCPHHLENVCQCKTCMLLNFPVAWQSRCYSCPMSPNCLCLCLFLRWRSVIYICQSLLAFIVVLFIVLLKRNLLCFCRCPFLCSAFIIIDMLYIMTSGF